VLSLLSFTRASHLKLFFLDAILVKLEPTRFNLFLVDYFVIKVFMVHQVVFFETALIQVALLASVKDAFVVASSIVFLMDL